MCVCVGSTGFSRARGQENIELESGLKARRVKLSRDM